MKKIGTIIIITLFVIIESAMALKYEKSKVIEKVFSCKEGTELSVLNKYGDITVHVWDKDEVKIKYTIVVEANQEILDEMLDKIEIKFSEESNHIRVETYIDDMQKGNMKGEKAFSYSITYDILAPKYIHLNMKNSNGGGVYIHDCIGNITSDLKYGHIFLSNTNSPNVKINAYNGNIDLRNCGKNTENIDITNKYGKISFDGYYDHFKINAYNGNVDVQNKKLGAGKILILNKYGNVTLNGYSKEIEIDAYNGNIQVNGDLIAENTNIKNKYGRTEFRGKSKNMTIESYNGNVDIANESIPGNINISNKYGGIKYIGCFEEMILNSYNSAINVENTGDRGENATITTKYGNIKYVGYAKNMNLTNHNGNIDVGNETSPKIENLTVASAYGRVNLNNIENINITTNNDTYNILNSNSITIDDAKYTSFNVSGLKESFITMNQIKFGKINIRQIAPDFKNIQISNHYSTISLYFKQLNNNKIDISGKFGKIKIADIFKKDITIVEEESSFTVKKEGTGGSIIINNQYGNVVLDTE